MKNPFKKRRGMEAAPQSAQHYADQLHTFLQGLSIEDKARVIAATKTAGHMELRLRFDEKGRQSMSVWLARPGTDEAIKIIPSDERAVIHLPEHKA